MALRPALLVPDPFARASVFVFHHLHVAVDERRRLLGVAVQAAERNEVLVAICGRDELREIKRRHNRLRTARRNRARARARAQARA